MGLPEVSLGVIPGYGGTQRLAHLVGKGKAMEMITTATMLSAVEAKEWGLVNHVCTQEELIPMAEKIALKSFMDGLAQVIAGGVEGTAAAEPGKPPYNVKMEAEPIQKGAPNPRLEKAEREGYTTTMCAILAYKKVIRCSVVASAKPMPLLVSNPLRGI